jgi:hypothetical protein
LSESCPKIGDVPKSPFPSVAALVPSAGTITLQIKLRSDAGALSTLHPVGGRQVSVHALQEQANMWLECDAATWIFLIVGIVAVGLLVIII